MVKVWKKSARRLNGSRVPGTCSRQRVGWRSEFARCPRNRRRHLARLEMQDEWPPVLEQVGRLTLRVSANPFCKDLRQRQTDISSAPAHHLLRHRPRLPASVPKPDREAYPWSPARIYSGKTKCVRAA